MAGLHVTLGRASLRGPLQVIYVGESAAEARAAEAASVLPWIVRLDNPPVVRKHNMHAEANQAAAAALALVAARELDGQNGPDGPDGPDGMKEAVKPKKK